MIISRSQSNRETIRIISGGGIGILKTDTIYGLVGSALNKETVERIYKLRYRNPGKPMIILISSIFDLRRFLIKIDSGTRKILNEFWPGKVSIILPCPYKKFSYLHRGTKTLAFRLPAKKSLRGFVKITGPLVAPSANTEGEKPAQTIAQAKKYFGKKVDFYVDEGASSSLPSTLIMIKNGQPVIKRPGAVQKLFGK